MDEKPERESGRNRIGPTLIALVLPVIALVVGVSLGARLHIEPPATTSLNDVRTQAVGTFSANLTRSVQLTLTGSATPAGQPTSTPEATAALSSTPACHALRFVRDVTIPDNTAMMPAQLFTKSWLVENVGTCPWKAGYEVALIGGAAMGGSPFKLIQDVAPGGRIQVSIKMVAPPNQKGTVQGTWKMSDETGGAFGDFMSVVIVVGSPSGTPATAVATPTR